jgi:hypothetical protein
VACAGCATTRYVVIGPQPAPCTDSIAARVARLPTDSVTVADREHALWAHEQCQVALAARADSARRGTLGAAPGTAARAGADSAVWPPPACTDSVAARVARMPPDSVTVADRQHAAAARQECEIALASPPPPPVNAASGWSTGALAIGAALFVILVLTL